MSSRLATICAHGNGNIDLPTNGVCATCWRRMRYPLMAYALSASVKTATASAPQPAPTNNDFDARLITTAHGLGLTARAERFCSSPVLTITWDRCLTHDYLDNGPLQQTPAPIVHWHGTLVAQIFRHKRKYAENNKEYKSSTQRTRQRGGRINPRYPASGCPEKG